MAFAAANDALFVATSRGFLLRHDVSGITNAGAPSLPPCIHLSDKHGGVLAAPRPLFNRLDLTAWGLETTPLGAAPGNTSPALLTLPHPPCRCWC